MRAGSATCMACVGLLCFCSASQAATIAVTTTHDEFGSGPRCALREAVQAANTDSDFGGCVRQGTGAADTILLRGGKTYTRSLAGGEDANASGDLDVASKVTMTVKGSGKATIDANHLDRGIEVLPGASLTASRLILENGTVTPETLSSSSDGGGILNRGGVLNLTSSVVKHNEALTNNACGGCGGGIAGEYASSDDPGRTRLEKVSVLNNTVNNNGGGVAFFPSGRMKIERSTIAHNTADFSGGGIYLGADIKGFSYSIRDSTISANTALWNNGGGGAIFVGDYVKGRARATNVTISANRANGVGGGIYDRSTASGALKLNAATVAGNVADLDNDGTGDGGGVFGSPLVAENSILAGNLDMGAESDCAGSPTVADRHNLVGKGGGCDALGSNIQTIDPGLGPLAENGGPTKTRALKPGSPAIGHAGASSPGRDQRGVKRDSHPDIGAFERQ